MKLIIMCNRHLSTKDKVYTFYYYAFRFGKIKSIGILRDLHHHGFMADRCSFRGQLYLIHRRYIDGYIIVPSVAAAVVTYCQLYTRRTI